MTAKTRALLASDIATYLQTNGSGLITAQSLRDRLLDIVDSGKNSLDDTTTTTFRALGDTNTVIQPADQILALTTALTAPRVITLPAASAKNPGAEILIVDLTGSVSATNTLTIQRAGSDTVNGTTSIVLTVPFAGAKPFTDGVSKWGYNLPKPASIDVSHTDPNTGGVTTSLFEILRRLPITPQSFAAASTFDGVQDNGPAIQAAATAAGVERRQFRLPGHLKNYISKQQIFFTGPISAIVGDSRTNSRILWPADSVGWGLNIAPTSTTEVAVIADVQDISLLSAGPGLGIAVNIDFDAFQSGGVPLWMWQPRFTVNNIYVGNNGNALTQGFNTGLRGIQPANVQIENMTFQGKIDRVVDGAAPLGSYDKYTSDYAIVLNKGTAIASGVQISDCVLCGAKTGLRTDGFEGVLMSHCQIVGNENGVVFVHDGGKPHYEVSGTHVNSNAACITTVGVSEVLVSGCDLYKINNSDAAIAYGIIIQGPYARASRILGNNFNNSATTQAFRAISIQNGAEGTVIDGNTFRKATEGAFRPIEVLAGADQTHIGDNNIYLQQTEIVGGFDTPRINDAGTRTRMPAMRTRVPLAASQSIAAGATVVPVWTTPTDAKGVFFSSGANTRLTCPIGGLYEVEAHLILSGGAGFREVSILKNGAVFAGSGLQRVLPVSTGAFVRVEAGKIKCSKDDYFTLSVLANTDGCTLDPDSRTWFQITRVGDVTSD
jgi:hypothetical protein